MAGAAFWQLEIDGWDDLHKCWLKPGVEAAAGKEMRRYSGGDFFLGAGRVLRKKGKVSRPKKSVLMH